MDEIKITTPHTFKSVSGYLIKTTEGFKNFTTATQVLAAVLVDLNKRLRHLPHYKFPRILRYINR